MKFVYKEQDEWEHHKWVFWYSYIPKVYPVWENQQFVVWCLEPTNRHKWYIGDSSFILIERNKL